MQRIGSSIAILAALLVSSAAHAITIDFNQFHNPEESIYVDAQLANISGYRFTDNCSDPGSCLQVFGTAYGAPGEVMDFAGASVSPAYQFTTTTLRRADGGAFNLLSMDLADGYNQGSTFVPGPGGGSTVFTTLTFTFQYAAGTTATRTVALDALPGGQTVSFAQTGLTSVSWRVIDNRAFGSAQFDNVVVTTPVPEPGTWALMLGGAGLLGATRAARKRKTQGHTA